MQCLLSEDDPTYLGSACLETSGNRPSASGSRSGVVDDEIEVSFGYLEEVKFLALGIRDLDQL